MLFIPHIGEWFAANFHGFYGTIQTVLARYGIPDSSGVIALWSLWAICGVSELCLSSAVCTGIERLWPLTRWEQRNPIASDVTYAFFVRIVLFPLIAYFEYSWLHQQVTGIFQNHAIPVPSLPALFPALKTWPAVTFILNFAVLDFADYWRHRLSHRYGWWYGIHSLHHAEDQMTFWSDDRSHVLEDAITYVWLIAVGLAIGVPPFQFPFLILGFRFLGSISHSNTTLSYGWLGNRVLVSPRFHRTHHALQAAGRRNRNLGTALSLWDVLFATARFQDDTVETGDTGADEALVHGSWFAQQRAGFQRMVRLAQRRRKTTQAKVAL